MSLNGRVLLWAFSLFLYLVFVWWYTNTGGPLGADEIEATVAEMRANGTPPERIARMQRFMEEDRGGQLLMVNLLDLATTPAAMPGIPPGTTSEEAMAHYMEYMLPAMLKRASHPIFFGQAQFRALELVGIEGAESWDQVGIVRYRSRRDLLEIAVNPVFDDRHPFKVAALEKTIAFPVTPQLNPGDPRLLLFVVMLAMVAVADILLTGRTRRSG